MRVLLATPGTDVGGAERIVLALAHALPRRGHEVVLWGPGGRS
jgi:UDP:flavonoid glycosyltransferase YjiC (YdhE family)